MTLPTKYVVDTIKSTALIRDMSTIDKLNPILKTALNN